MDGCSCTALQLQFELLQFELLHAQNAAATAHHYRPAPLLSVLPLLPHWPDRTQMHAPIQGNTNGGQEALKVTTNGDGSGDAPAVRIE